MINNKKISAIIQVRMESIRLPGKALLLLANKPSLWWTIKRISLSKFVDKIIIATTTKKSNNPIEYFYNLNNEFDNLFLFRYQGNEEDVLDRVIVAANYYKTDIIIDITADCNVIDPRHIDHMIKILLDDRSLDYVSNCIYRDWADGLDLQIYWTDALMKVKRMFDPTNHVGWNIAQHPGIFNFYHWKASIDMCWSDLGLTLDTPEDLKLLEVLFNKFGNDPAFHIEDVIRYLRANPNQITNANVRRKTPEEG